MLDSLLPNLCYLWFELFISSLVLQVFTFSQKISVNFQLLLRFIQGLSFLLAIAGLAVAVALTNLSIPDIFACILAFVPTGWGILSVSLSYLCYFHLSKPLSLSLSRKKNQCLGQNQNSKAMFECFIFFLYRSNYMNHLHNRPRGKTVPVVYLNRTV